MARASLLFLELRLEPLSWLEPHYYLVSWGSSLLMGRASLLLFNLLRLKPLSWLEPHYYFWSWIIIKSVEAWATFDDGRPDSGLTPFQRPDPFLYTFMQCINVYKKYWHGRDQADIFLCRQKKYTQICHIKKYRPDRTPLCEVYVLAYTWLNICRHVYATFRRHPVGACRNSPKHVYIFLYAFRRKPKSPLNARPSSIFFFRHKGAYFLCQSKNIGRAGALPIFFIHAYRPPTGA
jgi:hypothetical protein